MRRFLCLCLTASLCFGLFGCYDYKEPNSSYIISAIGFDIKNGESLIILESAESEERRLLKAMGEDFYEAFETLESSFLKTPDFTHTACIVLSTGLKGDALDEITDFCKSLKGLSKSTYIIASISAERLLNSQPQGDAVGYDIVSLLRENKKETARLETINEGNKIAVIKKGANGIQIKEKSYEK